VDFEAVGVVTSLVLSVLASAVAVLAWRAADPIAVRKLSALVASGLREVQDEVLHVRDVELPRMVGQAEALLERADLRFSSAESKRKTADGKLQRLEAEPAEPSHLDPTLSDGQRRDALRRHMHMAS